MATIYPTKRIIKVNTAFDDAIEVLKKDLMTTGISDTVRRVVLDAAKEVRRKAVK